MSSLTLASLKDQIAEQVANFRKDAPEEVKELMAQKTAELEATKLSDQALKVGDQAPDFELPNAAGGTIKLSELLKSGAVILNFYRGGWCPYCNLELRSLQQALPEFERYNAQLVAISPETPDNSLSTHEKNELAFPVLSDVGNIVAKEYGLVFVLDPALQELYTKFGLDIPGHNGDESFELPMPATYVVDPTGVIIYAFAEEDYLLRAEPSDIVAAIAQS
ncbi:MAG: peroxiredoxin-like family protein [Limnothrix sp.]